MDTSLAEDISFATVSRIANCALKSNALDLEICYLNFLAACFRMNIQISDFDKLDKDFALKAFEKTFY